MNALESLRYFIPEIVLLSGAFLVLGVDFFAPLLGSPFLAIVATAICYPLLHDARRRVGVTEHTCLCVGRQIVEVLALMRNRRQIAPLLEFADESAGGRMTTDFVALHKPSYIGRLDILEGIREGGTFLINCDWPAAEVFEPFRLYFLGLLLLGFIFWGKANFK